MYSPICADKWEKALSVYYVRGQCTVAPIRHRSPHTGLCAILLLDAVSRVQEAARKLPPGPVTACIADCVMDMTRRRRCCACINKIAGINRRSRKSVVLLEFLLS